MAPSILAALALSDWIVALSTVAYVALTAVLASVGLRQSRHAEVSLIGELTSRWRSLDREWSHSMLVARGPDSYYNIATPIETKRYAELLASWTGLETGAGSILESGYWLDRRSLDNRFREYEQSAAAVLEFLASVSLLVLTGRLSVEGAYTVIGPQVIRNGGSLRELMPKLGSASEGDRADPNEMPGRVRNWGTYRPGVVRRVFILMDVLWAMGALLGDLAPFELAEAADAKEAGSGEINRRRLREEVGRTGNGIADGWRARKLSNELRRAEWRSSTNRVGLDRRVVEGSRKPWLSGEIR